ncbi:maleylpyruvate isomerase family mycothiol-dependent enzyme [Paractinoplanes rishiriensis]|uniref:Mycothiol-dependent maleylpyruvate isomerase metal-binding domain-containing protein n=1 Tax=Paractinoplanes rishiriensis TaxID=1050105 RepID=A0A919MM39_9ACTN|nr:maleylpyruvate isomerase family mycothiol-dependent enzyme [Actinoplanes rishiriensis]GIE92556.1 hypothetical protein Ari01nite_00210 [Actinoplanes rishiriensis]
MTEIWTLIESRRLSVAGLLDDLSPAEWEKPSLCPGWTVRDVAAHLTLQQMGLRDALPVLTHWKGSMHRTIADAARRRSAELTTAQIAADIRDTAARRRRNLGVTPLETLTDLLVHEQDMAIPLGREVPMPPEAAALSCKRVLTMRMPPPQPSMRRTAGLRLVATDIDWSHGTGPEVAGPMAALLLITTGRTVALPRLSGPGMAALTARFEAAGG